MKAARTCLLIYSTVTALALTHVWYIARN